MSQTKCEFCDEYNTENNLLGGEGIVVNKDKKYLFIAHFQNEYYRINVKYCPECGKKLSE